MHSGTFRVERIFINDDISLDFRAQKFGIWDLIGSIFEGFPNYSCLRSGLSY